MCNRSIRRRGEKERTEEIFKEIMPKKTPSVPPTNPLINTSKNLNKLQGGKIQRSAHSYITVKRQGKKKILKREREK